jgi:hypothetical protein
MLLPYKRYSRFHRLSLNILLALSFGFGAFPLAAIAQEFIPPDRGVPGRREGGGTRGCWQVATTDASTDRLIALAPPQNFAYTLSPYPTFFLYVPQVYAEQAVAAEFLLVDDAGNEVYQSRFQTDTTSGLIQITLPDNANLPPLEVGRDYQWSFALVCSTDPGDASANIFVDSWVQRIEPSEELAATLATASPEEQINALAEAGVWYDTLEMITEQPPEMAATQWANILNSVDLADLSDDLSVQTIELAIPESMSE